MRGYSNSARRRSSRSGGNKRSGRKSKSALRRRLEEFDFWQFHMDRIWGAVFFLLLLSTTLFTVWKTATFVLSRRKAPSNSTAPPLPREFQLNISITTPLKGAAAAEKGELKAILKIRNQGQSSNRTSFVHEKSAVALLFASEEGIQVERVMGFVQEEEPCGKEGKLGGVSKIYTVPELANSDALSSAVRRNYELERPVMSQVIIMGKIVEDCGEKGREIEMYCSSERLEFQTRRGILKLSARKIRCPVAPRAKVSSFSAIKH